MTGLSGVGVGTMTGRSGMGMGVGDYDRPVWGGGGGL